MNQPSHRRGFLQKAAFGALGAAALPSLSQANITSPDTDRLLNKAPFPNAVPRTLTSKLSDMVNILDFGAKPDGSDSTRAIQNAINDKAAQAGGLANGVIYFPPGTYGISSTIKIPAGISIKGEGAGITMFRAIGQCKTVFSLAYSSTHHFEGFGIELVQMKPGTCDAFLINHVFDLSMENVSIFNASIGLKIICGSEHRYSGVRIRSSQTSGIEIHGKGKDIGSDYFFRSVVMDSDPAAQPKTAGMCVRSSGAIWLDGCDFIHQHVGLLLAPTLATDFIEWLFTTNSAFDSCSDSGVVFAPAEGTYVNGTSFSDCWAATCNGYGFRLAGAGRIDGLRIDATRVFNNQRSGILVSNPRATNLFFSNCDVSCNSTAKPKTDAGIEIAGGVSGFNITGCRSGQLANFPNTQQNGILVCAGSSNHYMVTNNDLRLNGVGLLDLGTGTNKIVNNNLL